MKIFNLGLDNSVLDKNSVLAGRVIEYGNLVERYDMVVSSRKDEQLNLSEKARAVGVKATNKLIRLFKLYQAAKKLLAQVDYDVITVQDQYYLALVGLKLAKRFKLGLEIQVHGFEKYYGLRKLAAKFVLPRADAVRAVSQRLKKRLLEEFGVEENKITVVPIWTNLDLAKSAGALVASAPRDDKVVFLTVGRLVPVKNIDLQLRAMNNAELRMKKAELWIAGEGPEKEKLKVESEKLKLDQSIKFFGQQKDLSKFYGQADVFLLTSQAEGWGLAVVEAAAHGLPIIMTDVGCAGEVIVNGVSGIVIPAGNQEKLEAAMIKLVRNKELREKLGAGARAAVKQLPNKEETLKLYLQSWRRAVKHDE